MQRRMISVVVFCIFAIIIFCFVVAICVLVQALEAMYGLPYVLTVFGNPF